MPEKINISDLKFESYADKTLKTFSAMIADPENKFGIGSLAAEAASNSVALALRAIKITADEDGSMKKAADELELMRTYFVHLIDEENKAKAPLEKRLAAPDSADDDIEAGYRTACVIVDEVLYSLINAMNALDAVSDKLCPCSAPFAAASIFFARAAMDTVRVQKAKYSTKMNEAVYARTTRREPEIAIEGVTPMLDALQKKLEEKIK